jgi:malate dehydrogenase
MSAANGVIDHVKSLLKPTAGDDWISAAVLSEGQYGVPRGLVFSFPCSTDANGNFTVIEGLKLDPFGQQKFQITLKELEEERGMVQEILRK